MKFNSDLEITQSIINEIPSSKLEHHKELLFGLFLFTEGDGSNNNDVPYDMINSKKRFLSPSEYALETMKIDCRPMASPLSSLTELVRSFSMQKKHDIDKDNDHTLVNSNENSHDFSSSVDLKEIEETGMMKFHKHILPKLSSHDYHIKNINQYHKSLLQDKELQCSPNNNKVMDQMLDPLSSAPTFSPFSIKFNECSLFAISHWAAKSSFSNDSEEVKDEVTKQYYPAPDVKLRKCNVCNLWGHYDIECDRMTKSDVFYFSDALQNQSTKPLVHSNRSRVEQTMSVKECSDTKLEYQDNAHAPVKVPCASENGPGCSICGMEVNIKSRLECSKCKSEFHIGCVELSFTVFLKDSFICPTCSGYEACVDLKNIESCGRFVFEQSKDVLPKDSGYLNYVNDSQSCAGSEIVEIQGLSDDSHLARDENLLSPNDLCWAKRGNAVAGSLGKDKWWPGMIIYAFDTRDSNRNQGQVRTSFVVRFFCCQGGGRVRATEIIPFFTNFDFIWKDRMSHPDEPDYSFFIKALKEASSASKCSFPTDPSTQTTEKRKYKRSISEISLASSTDVINKACNDNKDDKTIHRDWEDAEVSEQDGIIILAKRSSVEKNTHANERESSRGHKSMLNGEGRTLNNSSIAATVKQFFEQTKEDEDKSNFTENCLSLSNDELLGSMVSWSVSALNRDDALDFSTVGRSKIQYGRVLAASLSNSKALVRTVTSSDALNHLPLQMRTSINYKISNDCGNTMWIPLKQLKLINSEPNVTLANEMTIGAPTNKIIRSISINDSLNHHQETHIRNTSLDGRWKKDPNDRYSSTTSKTPSVADTLQKSLAKLTNGKTSSIYQAERILNDRIVKSGCRSLKQYLIKWEGVNEITWEPEGHIFDTNLLDMYHEKKKSKIIESSNSNNDDPRSKGKYKSIKNLCCPFCGVRCKDGQSLGGHIRMHNNEPNYKEILDSGKFLTSPLKNNDSCVELAVVSPVPSLVNIAKEFKCYFCGEICKDGLSYGGHVRKHINEPNYREKLDAAKFDRDKAFEKMKANLS